VRVSQILTAHDRALLHSLLDYIEHNPKADDLDQAYLNVFEVAIKNDWFSEGEPSARAYLQSRPRGSVRSMAQIVATMARAQAGKFEEAVATFADLVGSLESNEQLEFAANFADSLAAEAAAAGEFELARRVYRGVTQRFPDDPDLLSHAQDVLDRYDRVGKPSPVEQVTDLSGTPVDFRALRGKYVLIDFWATWCAPCQADLPLYQAAYARFKDRGFEIVSVSLDETPDAVSDYVRQRGIPWRQVHNATAGKDLVESFAVGAIPANVLLGPDGRVLRLDLRAKTLIRTLESLLRAPEPGPKAPTR
jgi:thiol-disulfide isomerase/thioredoxin